MDASSTQLPANPTSVNQAEAGLSPAQRSEQALVSLADSMPDFEPLVLTRAQGTLPVQLEVSIPIRDFRVKNLLALERAQLVEAAWDHEADVPLAAGEVQLAWSEFEVVDAQLAVRVTRLA